MRPFPCTVQFMRSVELKDDVTKGRIEVILFEVIAKLCGTKARGDVAKGKTDAKFRFATDIAGCMLEELEDKTGFSTVDNATELETEGLTMAAAVERFLLEKVVLLIGGIVGDSVPDAMPNGKFEGLLL